MQKYSIEELRSLAKHHGGVCLAKGSDNLSTPISWQCKKGHTWELEAQYVMNGAWCPKCSNSGLQYIKQRAKTLAKFKSIAAKKGGECLEDEFIALSKQGKWRCAKGHEWTLSFVQIKAGAWCRQCENEKKLAAVIKMAQKKGGKCLSETYVPGNDKMQWECPKGHQWYSTASSIRRGCWCPTCNSPREYTIKEMKLLAKQHGGKCLSDKYINSHTKLKWLCANGHEWDTMPSTVVTGSWCIVCAGKQKYTIEQMQKFANKNDGRCLSKVYINGITPLKWECKQGHIWKTIPSTIVHGGWCKKCSASEAMNDRRLGIGLMHIAAKKLDGLCLSTEYINVSTDLLWQCAKGHNFNATPASVLYHNSWCKRCKSKRSRKLSTQS